MTGNERMDEEPMPEMKSARRNKMLFQNYGQMNKLKKLLEEEFGISNEEFDKMYISSDEEYKDYCEKIILLLESKYLILNKVWHIDHGTFRDNYNEDLVLIPLDMLDLDDPRIKRINR